MSRLSCFVLAACAVLACTPAAFAQREFGFDNTRASGQPYLSPEESLKRMKVPPGWEIKLFAAEPDIINPISFTVDERGRLWVVECFEYPKRTAKGKKPRDRIKILEDTTGSGKADKVTVWAEGKDLPISWDLASGIEVGHGGVFLGAAPYLFYLKDAQGVGRCTDQQILLQGFGSQDAHETLNTMQWGPDGRLYGLHGIFTQSKVGGVEMNAAVWRYHVPAKKFDIFAEGTSNPWGLDFDAHGQAFLACCVIPHAFHMISGGVYIRQAGGSQNPYAYGMLREICDHTHHQESGWAHAGTLVLQGDHIPAEWQGAMLMGSIHGCLIKRDQLERNGSSFVARHRPDFLVSGDKNFRPINLRWGPDGSIYVIDWHDQNPCHQAHPDSWDMTHGRIYKIQRTGTKSTPPPDLSKKSNGELVELLTNNSPWRYRTALRLLNERQDRSVAPHLEKLLLHGKQENHCLRALWGLYAVGALTDSVAEKALSHESPWVRSWAVRMLGEAGKVSDELLSRFERLAQSDPAPEVRLQLASTAQRLKDQDTLPILHHLLSHRSDAGDPAIPLMIWLAYEPRVAAHPQAALSWLREHAAGNALVVEHIVSRTLRRLTATGKAEDLDAAVTFLKEVTDSTVRRQGLDGLVAGLQNRSVPPPGNWRDVFASLRGDEDGEVKRLALRLAVNFQDARAVQLSIDLARDTSQPVRNRLDAVRDLALAHPHAAQPVLLGLMKHEPELEIRLEACRALSAFHGPEVSRSVLAPWMEYPAPLRAEAVNLLAGHKDWAGELLQAVGNKRVPRTDLTDNTIMRLRAFRDGRLNEQIETVWGKVRENSVAELDALIDRMRREMDKSNCSAERGRKVFENNCNKCHRFEGQGHDVGPNLDGASRDLEYLLVNILDPNRVVGQPYYTNVVLLKNGQVETGLLAAEDKQSITIKAENDALKTIQRKSIEEITVQPKSLMPEGLANNMSVQDFRDLARYLMANPFITEVAETESPHRKLVTGPSGKIMLPPRHGEKETSLAAEVYSPQPLQTQLLIGYNHAVRVRLNGKTVYQGQPSKGQAMPDQAAAKVELRDGTNRLEVELTRPDTPVAVYLRFLDPGRKLQYPPVRRHESP